MPTDNTSEPVAVTQADRDAAADYADQHMATHVSWQKSAIEALRKGERDNHPLIQAFAHHAVAAEASLAAAFSETREFLGLLEQAICDWSCPTKWRSAEPQPHSKLHEDLRAVLFKHEVIARHRLTHSPAAEREAVAEAIYLRWNGADTETAKRDPAYMNRVSAGNLADAVIAAIRARPAVPDGVERGILVPEAKGSCGWPPTHDEQVISAGVSHHGWAKGERLHITRCRRCGEVRGPFVNNSSDAGF